MATKEILFSAVNSGNLTLVKSILEQDIHLLNIKDENGCTPLHIAVQDGFVDIAEYLISKGADVNEKDAHGYTCLHLVKSLEMAELLISKGAEVDVKEDYGLTPLHNAVLEGYDEIVVFLLSKGADINAVENKGFTPLKMAMEYQLPEIEQILRTHGAKD